MIYEPVEKNVKSKGWLDSIMDGLIAIPEFIFVDAIKIGIEASRALIPFANNGKKFANALLPETKHA